MKKKMHKLLISLGALSLLGTTVTSLVSCGTNNTTNKDLNDDSSIFKAEVDSISNDLKNSEIVFVQGSNVQSGESLEGSGDIGAFEVIQSAMSNYTVLDHFEITDRASKINTDKETDTPKSIPLVVTFYDKDEEISAKTTIIFDYTIQKGTPSATFDTDVNTVTSKIEEGTYTVDHDSPWTVARAKSLINSKVAPYKSISEFKVTDAGDLDTSKTGNQTTTLTVSFTSSTGKTTDKSIPINVIVRSIDPKATFDSDVAKATNLIKAELIEIDLGENKSNTYGSLKTELNSRLRNFAYDTDKINLDESAPVVADIYDQSGTKVTDATPLLTAGSLTVSVDIKFTSIDDSATTKVLKVSLNLDITQYDPSAPEKKPVLFSPYMDISLNGADKTLNDASSFLTSNKLQQLPSLTLAFLNYDSRVNDYTFAGNNMDYVQNITSQHPQTQTLIAAGGANAGTLGQEVPGQNTSIKPEVAAESLYKIIKRFNSKVFDWDLEGSIVTHGIALERITETALDLQNLAKADNYSLQQMVTVSGGGVGAWPVKVADVTEQVIDTADYTEYFNNPQNPGGVITSFYNAGIDAIANIMTMNFGTWKMNYDAAVPVGMGAVKNFLQKLRPDWKTPELYQHVGITPMIGTQDTTVSGSIGKYDATREKDSRGSGYFTYDKGVDAATYWAKKLGIGYLSFWSLSRDNPGPSTPISPLNYGMEQGSKFIFTKEFMAGLYE